MRSEESPMDKHATTEAPTTPNTMDSGETPMADQDFLRAALDPTRTGPAERRTEQRTDLTG